MVFLVEGFVSVLFSNLFWRESGGFRFSFFMGRGFSFVFSFLLFFIKVLLFGVESLSVS